MQMRAISRTAAVIVLTVTATLAYGQTNATSDATSAGTSATPSKKEVRAQNRALEKSVRRSINKTKGLSGAGINIIVRGSKVTLEGSVTDQSQIELAGKAASATSGVSHVDNRLTIREPGN